MSRYLLLLRPHQWVKNIFLFIPLIFSATFTDTELLLKTIIASISFSLLASAMYIFNDMKDVESDRKHPKKKLRPIASGKVSKVEALMIAFTLIALSFGSAYFLGRDFIFVLCIYVTLNLVYSLYTKNLPIWDILFLASFYIVRIFGGAAAIDVPVSSWLLLTSLFATLFIGAGKRYVELIGSGDQARKVLKYYNKSFLIYILQLSSFATLLSYTVYTTTKSLFYEFSIVFVVLGFMHYFYFLYNEDISEDPVQALMKSKSMFLILLSWGIYITVVIYLDL